jgi:hypothetical protein
MKAGLRLFSELTKAPPFTADQFCLIMTGNPWAIKVNKAAKKYVVDSKNSQIGFVDQREKILL